MPDNLGSEATMRELLEPLGESDKALLHRVLEKMVDERLGASDLLQLYLSTGQGHREQGTPSFHDTAGFKGLAEAFND